MIELKNIQVEFSRDGASATAAVDDVSLTILEGEVFGIIGSSGAGKSTLVRTINLLQKPTSGDIVIDGASIVGQTGARLRRNALRHRHDLPALQPMECQDRLRQRCLSFEVRPLEQAGHRGARRRAAGVREPGGEARRVPPNAERRTEAARGHRTRTGRQHAHPPVRRAHQRARSRNHKIGARRAETREPATWRDHRGHHPRA